MNPRPGSYMVLDQMPREGEEALLLGSNLRGRITGIDDEWVHVEGDLTGKLALGGFVQLCGPAELREEVREG